MLVLLTSPSLPHCDSLSQSSPFVTACTQTAMVPHLYTSGLAKSFTISPFLFPEAHRISPLPAPRLWISWHSCGHSRLSLCMILWAFQTIGCDGLSTERTLLFRGTTAMYLKKGPLMQRARCQYHQAGHMVMVPWCIFLAVVVPVVTAAYFPASVQETFTEIFFRRAWSRTWRWPWRTIRHQRVQSDYRNSERRTSGCCCCC